ncbi:site-specific integrase [Kineosporia sp. R_H_3]|uniref:tyrosine-type recombinase/integrase n=1 Tax=Kineosporia sp. R_H_3 TaxID=1961848 RepID=UPI000B4A9573|nr:site-specific integrase [Kineosporia sp. R_H_3]
MAVGQQRPRRARGSIEQLSSGALRVRVYAGYDSVTGRRRYLDEVIPAGPRAATQAERARIRLLNQVAERRHPKTSATMNQLLDRYFEVLDVDPNTAKTYRSYVDRHVRPVIGHLPLARVDGETLDSLYAQLRRCRRRCKGAKGLVDHRLSGEHACTDKCRPHACKPLAAGTVRQIHWILSGAFDRAVRWDWISVTPAGAASPPPPPRPNPSPPTPEQAALILNEAWLDEDWGTLVWLAMTTGARRGELCALKRSHYDAATRTLTIPASVTGSRNSLREKDTKTHQQRRVALGQETAALLDAMLERQNKAARKLAIRLSDKAYLFSNDPDCSQPLLPGTVTQRYNRLVERLAIETTFHKLRHYNATELIAAGVDLRTVAGRLGHGGGGVTTLRAYAAWVADAGRAAAEEFDARMPSRPSRASKKREWAVPE